MLVDGERSHDNHSLGRRWDLITQVLAKLDDIIDPLM